MGDRDLMEASRRALLRYYNSQTMTHGGYIIALVIGFLTVISRWTTFTENLIIWCIFSITISLLLASGVYILGRTLWWGQLAYQVMNINLIAKEMSKETVMFQLHEKTRKQVKDTHPKVNWFRRFRPDIIIIVFLILWVLFSLLIISINL